MKKIALICALALILTTVFVPVNTMASNTNLGVSNHTLTKNGTPYFLLGDTCWPIGERFTSSEMDSYIANAKAKKFNTIGVQAVSPPWALEGTSPNYTNEWGEAPFINNNPTQINTPFWDRYNTLLSKLNANDMYAYLLIGLVFNESKNVPQWQITTAANAYAYGRALGYHLRNYNQNIIWSVGLDDIVDPAKRTLYDACAEGVTDGVNNVNNYDGNATWSSTFITFHTAGIAGLTTQDLHTEAWLDMDGYQSYKYYNHHVPKADTLYGLTSPVKPFICHEDNYEGEITYVSGETASAWIARMQAYWSIFRGSSGFIYGADGVMDLGLIHGTDYNTALNYAGRGDMANVADLVNAKGIDNLVPDSSIITSGLGTADSAKNYKCAVKVSGGSSYLVYITNGDTITCDLSKITTGTEVLAKWFNPRTGAYTTIGTYAKTSRQFDPSGSPGADNDWVLVLEASAATSTPAPTQTPPPGGNLITNASFETGAFSPWTYGAPFSISTEQTHAGTYSVKLVNANTWNYLGQTVSVSPNTDYTWKLWIRSSGASGAQMRVLRKSEDGGGLVPGTSAVNNVGGSVWTQYTIPFNSGSLSQVVLTVSDSASGKTHYIDDMMLTADGSPPPTPTPTPPSNLVVNPSFETGAFTPWTYGAPFSISTEQAHAGTYSVKLVNASTWGYLGQVVSVTPGTAYTWKLWIRSSGASGAQMRVLKRSEDGGGLLEGTSAVNNQGGSIWREYTINFNSGSYSQLILTVSDSASGKTHYIDDMTLTVD